MTINRARILRIQRQIEAERETARETARRNDSQTAGFTAKVPADHPDYAARVARPTMEAIDGLPKAYRACVARFDYIDVYRAWRRGWPVERIEQRAAQLGGVFRL